MDNQAAVRREHHETNSRDQKQTSDRDPNTTERLTVTHQTRLGDSSYGIADASTTVRAGKRFWCDFGSAAVAAEHRTSLRPHPEIRKSIVESSMKEMPLQ
jgi:hypothetical protein